MEIKLNSLCEFNGSPIPVSMDEFEMLKDKYKEYSDYGALMSSLVQDHFIRRKDSKVLRYFWNGSTVEKVLENWAFKSAKKSVRSFHKTYMVFEDRIIFWIDEKGGIFASPNVKKTKAVLRRKFYRKKDFRVPFSEEGEGFRDNIYNDIITERIT